MKLVIHRGAHEIGGTCVQIESEGTHLVLDFGLPLTATDSSSLPLPRIPGFAAPDDALAGVVISHPHQDHYGLIHRLPERTKVLIGAAAARILADAAPFSPGALTVANPVALQDRVPVRLDPFTITPYLIDHSAFDSFAVLVESEGRRLLYTGDLRAHGRKAGLFQRLVRHPPSGVDALLIEGTTLGRPDAAEPPAGEESLVDRFVEQFDERGLTLVWASAQNIDRLVTLYKACRRARKTLIIDVYTALILEAARPARVPQAGWSGIRVFLPGSQRRRIVKDQRFDLAERFRPYRIFPEELSSRAGESVLLFRPSMMPDIDAIGGLRVATMIHSLWPGYLENGSQARLLDWLEHRGARVVHCHTSGHASPADLLRLRRAFPEATAIPLHTSAPAIAASFFDQPVRLLSDGEWYELGSE